jgi:hypothetical protein
MERSVEILATVLFGVIGLSHVVQPRAWADYFIFIRGKRETGAFIDECAFGWDCESWLATQRE